MTKQRKYKEKVCEWCGETYKPTGQNQKVCSNCTKLKKQKYNKEYNINYKQEISIQKKKYYQENINKKREYNKEYHKINKEKRNKYNKEYYQKNREKALLYRKRYYDAHVEEISIKNKERNKKNRENGKTKEKAKKYYYKVKDNLNFKIKRWCRYQIFRCLNFDKNKATKVEHTFDILGYTPEQLKQRLEMNFKPDMNWENHGMLWHIDHVKPLCKFNFIDENGKVDYHQVFLANCLANLQPLYVEENLSKGGK